MDTQRYIETEFTWIKKELTRMGDAIEKLAETAVTERSFEKLQQQMDTLEAHCEDITMRQAKNESDLALLRRFGVTTLSVIAALVTAWISGLLNI